MKLVKVFNNWLNPDAVEGVFDDYENHLVCARTKSGFNIYFTGKTADEVALEIIKQSDGV